MSTKTKSAGNPAPLVLLFSPRERIRSILSAGLLQCNFRLIDASTSYLAGVKASQFLPDIIFADIQAENSKDFLLLTRLRKSLRTRRLPLLVAIPSSASRIAEYVKTNMQAEKSEEEGPLEFIEFPFNFADLLKKIERMIGKSMRNVKEGEPRDVSENVRISEKLFDPQIPVLQKLREIESVLQRQWAFPFTVVKALDIVDSDSSCCDQLGKCIESDPSVTSAILKVANTVYYASREHRITSVKDAVVRLGFRETRNLLACMTLINISAEQHKRYGFTRHEFWLHSLSTALIAEKLCLDAGYRRSELAFLAGLVHDLGKIPLDNNFESVFTRLLEDTSTHMLPFYDIEERLMGFSHASLAHYLLSSWNFPDSVSVAVLNHHNLDTIGLQKSAMDRILQEAVFAANIFSKAMNMGHSCDEVLDEIPHEVLMELKIPNGPGESFFAKIFRGLSFFCNFLGLSTKGLYLTKAHPDVADCDILMVYGGKSNYHPIMTALRNNGYHVMATQQLTAEMTPKARIIIFIPDSGAPLDITVGEEIQMEASSNAQLKIFLLDLVPKNESKAGSENSNIVMMSRHNLDIRYLFLTFDHFLGKVIVPQKENIEPIPPPVQISL
jgi:putative nucleotidyltransferase with HDIG domain